MTTDEKKKPNLSDEHAEWMIALHVLRSDFLDCKEIRKVVKEWVAEELPLLLEVITDKLRHGEIHQAALAPLGATCKAMAARDWKAAKMHHYAIVNGQGYGGWLLGIAGLLNRASKYLPARV